MCDPFQKDCAEAAAGDSRTDAAATSNTDFMPLFLFKESVSDPAQTLKEPGRCMDSNGSRSEKMPMSEMFTAGVILRKGSSDMVRPWRVRSAGF
jgi:hypothetical protein